MKSTTLRLAVLIVCALFQVHVLAEYPTNYANVDVSRWKCLLCEFDTYSGATGRLSVASVHTTDDADRFGRNGSFEHAGTRSLVDAQMGVHGAGGWLFSANARNIGLDSNDIAFDIKNQGSLEATFRFQQYRRLTESDALTPFRLTNGQLSLGSNWQQGLQTNGFTSLPTANRLVELATTRRLLESTITVEVIPRVTLSLAHRSTSKEGVQETFRDGILQSTAIPKTIDQDSITNDIQISYRDPRLSTAWSRTRSRFDNLEPLLRWESPYRFGLLVNESANAFSHDHFSDTFDIKMSLPRNGMLRYHERRGETETQPQTLRYGLSNLIDDVEPVLLSAKRRYLSRRLQSTMALSRTLELSASHLLYEIKDLRPTDALTPAIGGLFLGPLRHLRSGDINRRESELGLNYRPNSSMRVLSRIWSNSITRESQEVEQNETRGLEVKLTQPINDRWESFTTLRSESRNASEFQSVTTNNPNTRRFHQADMTRRVGSVGMSFLSGRKNDFVSLAVDLERQDYPASILGLSANEIRGLTLGYGLQIGNRVVADGHVGSHRRFAEINGSQSLDLSMPWTYTSDNVVNSAGLKLSIEPINKFVENMLVDYTLSDGQTRMETLFDSSTSFFPDQISRHESIELRMRFGETFGITVDARIYIEKYEASDWSIDNVTQTSLSNILTMSRNNPAYDNTLVSLTLNRSF
ncbi:MAG: MtrB/PioB family outer membrane beta-barrel protein [Gammaproteobacteria bacterium]|nr:MtrB/PioB family outer membrane beta-barrel protein [Gammaproteobacteria bacterium]